MTQPLVTIVTVTRNLITAGRADFFRQCVESVRMQDYPNIEHLIVDGASDDGSVELFKELNLDFVSEPDRGISDAYNKGIHRAHGKYIAFLSDDDLYSSKQAVSLVVKALEDSQADFTYAPFNTIDADGKILFVSMPGIYSFPIRMAFGYPTMFTRKSVLEELKGHSENYRIAGDFDLVCRTILSGFKPVYIPEPFVSWRLGGVSDTQKKKVRLENIRVLSENTGLDIESAGKYYERKYLPENVWRQLLSKTSDAIDSQTVLKLNRKRFFKFICKQIFTLHLRKGKRCFRLLGITFYNEVNI